jgi:hypothetical protein
MSELVHIEWNDHHMKESWCDDVNAFHGPAKVQTVGWIVKEDEMGCTIAQSISADDELTHEPGEPGNLLYLVKSCIVRRTIIQCPK